MRRVDFSLPILYYGSMSNFKRYYQDKNIVFITIVTYNRQQTLVKNIELLSIKKQDNTEKGNWGNAPEIKGSFQ